MGPTKRLLVCRSWCLATVLSLLLLSCSSDEVRQTVEQAPSTTDGSGGEGRRAGCGVGEEAIRFYVFADARWEFREAVDYPDDRRPLNPAEATLDWYAEHERFTPVAGQQAVEGVSLRISGHHAGLEEQRLELTGVELSEEQIEGMRAFAGSGDGPTIVTMAVDDEYTLMLLSYGAELHELRAIATELEPVCEQQWIESGGEILDCLPTEPTCG